MNSLYHTKKCDFTRNSSVQGLPDILKWHNLQSLNKALDLLIEFKFCKSDFSLSEQEQKLYGGYL